MNIADRIQHLRKVKGISQEQLADQLGVSRQAISKWESAQSSPDIEKVVIMSDFFGV
ncbi:MAG: helix-turn-helix domain-containing protein, partial [Blautia sp.]|nr:helix-turn-helix domain-containing protein [Blautia sp.]